MREIPLQDHKNIPCSSGKVNRQHSPVRARLSARTFILLELVALVCIPLLLVYNRTYQSRAELRMLFWHPQGSATVPNELISESNTRKLLLSSTMRERVNLRLARKLSERSYSQSLDLSSNRPDWDPQKGIYFRVSAESDSPERSKLLCQVASEELSERCQELGQEADQQFWDMQLLKAQSALGKWRHQHKVPDEGLWQARAPKLRRGLLISIAAAQMNLRELKDKPHSQSPELSQKTAELSKGLKELERSLDDLWLRGSGGEVVSDMEGELRERRVQVQKSLEADRAAVLDNAQALLEDLQKQEKQLSDQVMTEALKELDGLQKALGALSRARDLQMMQLSMYCLVYRPAQSGRLRAANLWELTPCFMATLALLGLCLAHRRGRLVQEP